MEYFHYTEDDWKSKRKETVIMEGAYHWEDAAFLMGNSIAPHIPIEKRQAEGTHIVQKAEQNL